ncbi:caspase family protein [Roseibium sp.]|uniref:caspase family protein n=1 Tax=Roseibium sp. TaxID=1936156 RepID=UPI003B504268
MVLCNFCVRQFLRCVFALAVVSAAFGTTAHAKRVALVVGIGAYEVVGELKNPPNDAIGVARAFEQLGFEVHRGIDLDRSEFEDLIRTFSRAAKGADAAVFYYAGHGIQVGNENFLLPADAEIKDEDDLDFETIRLNSILSRMEREVKTNIVLLDACRNNPVTRNLARSMGTRSSLVSKGLARVETGIGTLISFSTQPGNVALDGEEEDNSPFTASLLKHLATPDLDVAIMMRRVRGDVMSKTNQSQVPWTNSSLTGSFVFHEGAIDLDININTSSVEAGSGVASRPAVSESARKCELLVDPEAKLTELLFKAMDDAVLACQTAAQDDPTKTIYADLLAVAREQNAARQARLSSSEVLAEAYVSLYPKGKYIKDLQSSIAAGASAQPTGKPAPKLKESGAGSKPLTTAQSCPSDASRASYSIWAGGSIRYKQVKSGTHACGRKMRCVGGSNAQNIPRKCKWL